jgi:TorA maturation chaperone TorD
VQNAGGGVGDEDLARAQCYALISRLFYAPADVDLLKQLAGAGAAGPAQASSIEAESTDGATGASPYVQAFAALQDACRVADAEAVRQEYDDLFVGAGKALVTPYTSGYAVPHGPDRHLLALRERLVALGLVRRDSVFELEDHVSAVCDVMRWLIAGGHGLDEQHVFFKEFVHPGLGPFCSAIEKRAASSFYRAMAAYTRAFLAIEREAFDMDHAE